MPVPIPGSKVGSDNQKVKFLTIFGRPKTRFFDQISGVPGRAPLATNHAENHEEDSVPPFRGGNKDWLEVGMCGGGKAQAGASTMPASDLEDPTRGPLR